MSVPAVACYPIDSVVDPSRFGLAAEDHSLALVSALQSKTLQSL